MNNEQKFIVTVRFPPWGYNDKIEYPAFGVEYLIQVPIDTENIEAAFLKIWKDKIGRDGKEFDGEILFVMESQLVII